MPGWRTTTTRWTPDTVLDNDTMYDMHAVMCRALRLEFDDRDEAIVELSAPEGFTGFDVGAAISSRDDG